MPPIGPAARTGAQVAWQGTKAVGQTAYNVADRGVRLGAAGTVAVAGAGAAVAKPVVRTLWNNIILILALLFKLADAFYTQWTFMNTSFTIFLDVIFLILLTVHYNKNRLDITVVGFMLGTALMGWFVETMSLPLFNIFGSITPHVILAIAGIMVGAVTAIKKESTIGGIILIFWCEVGIPLLNEPQYYHQWFLEKPHEYFLNPYAMVGTLCIN